MPQTANSSAERLIDRHGRTVNYVRISVTDRCDFRCVYCMSEDMEFVPRAQLLTLEEIATIARAFTELGVDKIRITGGEPLIRRNVIKLFRDIGELSALRELVLSTNGSQLAHMAMDLKQAGVKRINISLDSLNADKFRRITRVGDLNKVMTGIETALQTGFERIKINAVILKNRNHDEVTGLVQYAIDKGIDISFIEEMPLGMIGDHDRTEVYYSSDEIRSDLEKSYTLIATTAMLGTEHRIMRSPISSALLAELPLPGRIGLLIGPEAHGLSNTEVAQCDFVVTIPTNTAHPTMNLSHAVAVLLYELSKRTKLPKVGSHVHHATAEDKAQVLRTLDRAMATLDFQSEEKRETQRKVWRRLLGKSFLTKREAMALIGFLKKLV